MVVFVLIVISLLLFMSRSNFVVSRHSYANEVGESFRALVHVNIVRLSYLVASTYVVGDAVYKGKQASHSETNKDCEGERQRRIQLTVLDTLMWQGLASVAIPGFTINRICAFSLFMLKAGTKLSPGTRKWMTMTVGLVCIPFIIKPIDRSVDLLMNNSIRKWTGVNLTGNSLIHHSRIK